MEWQISLKSCAVAADDDNDDDDQMIYCTLD